MLREPQIEAFWQQYLATRPPGAPRPASYDAWEFGDSPAMASQLGELVRQGVKTATTSLLWEYQAEATSLPEVGALSVILDGEGLPLCIIETTEVSVRPMNEVDAQFAYDEGENDRTLEGWLAAHWSFFRPRCAAIGRAPSETMPVVCERFRVVFGGAA